MHMSNTHLITGETLYFSASVVSSKTNRLSPLSEILYVELISDDGVPIHRAKHSIDQGKAQGEIFIQSLIGTGVYQLIVYTRWMKNFGDFFHHPIRIINPFEAYEVVPPEEKLSVDFFPEGGSLVVGKRNRLIAKVLKDNKPLSQLKGRLVNDQGEVLSSFETSKLGLIKMEYIPSVNAQYQIILEDLQGSFQFFPLPVPSDDQYAVKVDYKRDEIEFQVAGTISNSVQIEVFHGTDLLHSFETKVNQRLSVPKSKLPPGASLIVGKVDGKKVSERIVFKQPSLDLESRGDTTLLKQRSLTRVPLELEAPLNASISVRKVEDGQPSTLGVKGIDLLYGVDDFTQFEDKLLVDPKYQESLDQLLITSRWKLPTVERPKTICLLPDHRGEIVSGQIKNLDSIPLSSLKLAYSIIGNDYQVKVAEVDSSGYFSIIITPFMEDRVAYITSLDGMNADLIALDASFLTSYPSLTYPSIDLDSLDIVQIVEKSVRNQIENAYYGVRSDSVPDTQAYPEEFGQFEYFYMLDDLNRFPTIKDSFVEYIPTVAVRNRLDQRVFKIAPKNILTEPDFTPLVLLDGLPVRPDEILEFSPYRIESIGVINNRYFFGPMIFDGIVSFRTKRGDLHGFEPSNYARSLDYKGLSPLIEYQFPTYDSSNLAENNLRSRIPDYRDQLYWAPDVAIQPDQNDNIQFYTSDTRGTFEISIEGISNTGQMVSIRSYIIVE